MNREDIIKLVNEIANTGKEKGLLHLTTEDQSYDGRTIRVRENTFINFGSYSYLGLNLDERIINGAVSALKKYGTQFPSSRAYVSNTLYTEFEEYLKEIFESPLVITNSTTLGHQAVLPVVVERGDVVIMDHQVHSSVQESARLLKTLDIKVTMVRHNNMEDLEKKIIEYSEKYDKVWYLADGLYSMFGDFAPVKQLESLLIKYPKFHLYIDDAHSISWKGRNGRGYVLSEMDHHPRLIVAGSLNKAFASGGAVFLIPDEKLKEKVRNCGGNLIFAGQLPSPTLGGGIESAKIHLSDEIDELQNKLKVRVNAFNDIMSNSGLPILSDDESPIKFIGLSKPSLGYILIEKLLCDGYYANLAIFPAVSSKNTGLRITITVDHTLADIKSLCNSIVKNYFDMLCSESVAMHDIVKAFKGLKYKYTPSVLEQEQVRAEPQFKQEHYRSISDVPKEDWNSVLGDKGMFDWQGMHLVESIFQGNKNYFNNWDFYYYIVKDQAGVIQLATFFTITHTKDDLLASIEKSEIIEKKRKSDPTFLISKTLMLGSQITEGEHLYLNRENKEWKKLVYLFLDLISDHTERLKLEAVYLRDFEVGDLEMRELLMNQGFLPIRVPDSHDLELDGWGTPDEYLEQITHKKRYFLKKEVLSYSHFYEVEAVKNPTKELHEKWTQLYLNIKQTSYELNSFDLPEKFFLQMGRVSNCDVLQLKIKADYSISGKDEIVSTTFNYVTESGNYCGIILGLDYDYVESYNLYKQTVYQSIIRAKELGSKQMYLGLTASQVKRKFGAQNTELNAYVQVNDTYGSSLINFISE